MQKSIPLTSEVVTYDQVVAMINKAKTFSVTNCACRVHMGNTCDKLIEVCLTFDNIAKMLVDRIIATSAFIVNLNSDDCIGCFICLENRCPMKALEEKEDIVEINLDKCIGCGLCVSVCPAEALSMRRREVVPPVPATGKEMITTILKEKGKLEKFTQINNE